MSCKFRNSDRLKKIVAQGLFLASALGAGMLGGAPPTQAQSTVTASGMYSSTPPTLPMAELNSLQNSYQGSVASGRASTQTLPLSLQQALKRGLRYNLAVLLNAQARQAARGRRWLALSRLLPRLTTSATTGKRLVNLYAIGFPTSIRNINPISGPFNVFDARASVRAPILNLAALRNLQAASAEVKAAGYGWQDARDVVVLAISNAYLLGVAARTEVQAAAAQVNTAQALYRQAEDRYHAGFSPEIDTLRARVELQSREQHWIAARNEARIARLNLARLIGLPDGQRFRLSTPARYQSLRAMPYAQAFAEALTNRADYHAAAAAVHAAQARRRAIMAERYPWIGVAGDFGAAGFRPTFSHDTFSFTATLHLPVFQGGRVRGELMQAEAQLQQAEDRLNDLRGQIAYDLRTALLNIQTANQQVAVARSNTTLARQTLAQARDRYAAGVTDNLEVVEAQETVAVVEDAYIASLYQDNAAKISLARALGNARQTVLRYIGGN